MCRRQPGTCLGEEPGTPGECVRSLFSDNEPSDYQLLGCWACAHILAVTPDSQGGNICGLLHAGRGRRWHAFAVHCPSGAASLSRL